MNHYLILNNLGAQPIKSKAPIRSMAQGRELSADGTCSAIVIVSVLDYYFNVLKWRLQNKGR